ncbi:La- protein 4 [Lunasporangiospora selenospora]|uniref:La- protein 4 n=1 Tax=Lunasporangiospora selenospora TaxID=979761 RepID=A0A9P6G2X9_9FUNG|nr:La- protein 4 [Lunasporangiospora selenospora]
MAATTGVRPFAPQEQSSTKTTVGPKGDRQHESSTSVVMPTPPRLGTGGRPYNNSGTRGTNGGPHGSKHHPRHDFASNDPNFDPFPQQYRPTQQQAHLNQRRQTAGHGVSHSPTYHHRSPHPAAHNNTFVTMGMPIMPSSQYDYSSSLNMHHGISSQRPPKRPPIHPRGGDGNPQNGSGSRQERPSRTPPFYTKTGRQGGSGGRNHAAKITTGGWAQNSGHANAPALPYASQWGYHTNSSVPIPVPPPSTTGTVQDTVVLQANNQQEKEIGLEDDDQDDVEVVMTRYGGCSTQQISGPTSAGAPKDQGHERDHLREQLEWYFSPRNLSVDTYLAGFKMVKALTSDINEVVAAFRRSSVVTVDETGTLAKPISVDRPRTTLILRDLLEDTQEEEIANLFKEGNCPAKTITKEVGNTWFVEFDTAENALAMLNFTRGQTLRGYPIAGRLKSNTVLTGGE